MTWLWLNMPLAALFFAAWSGIPMWLVLRHPEQHREPAAEVPAQALQAVPVAATDETSGRAPSPGIRPAVPGLAVPR